jgi:5-formyltetrahydrofolate cyclo-ligase
MSARSRLLWKAILGEKSRIREFALKKRDLIEPDPRKRKDASIRHRLFSTPEFIEAKVILFYASFRSEVSTSEMLKDALAAGKRVILPAVDKDLKELRLYEIGSLSDVSPGFMGIPEPSVNSDQERDINVPDLIIMPGAAFDVDGNRLGYGAGYYDKLLSRVKKRIPLLALAYEEQIVDSIPSQPHDIQVDTIVTDSRVITCHPVKSTPAA